jgi:hypothetical protein
MFILKMIFWILKKLLHFIKEVLVALGVKIVVALIVVGVLLGAGYCTLQRGADAQVIYPWEYTGGRLVYQLTNNSETNLPSGRYGVLFELEHLNQISNDPMRNDIVITTGKHNERIRFVFDSTGIVNGAVSETWFLDLPEILSGASLQIQLFGGGTATTNPEVINLNDFQNLEINDPVFGLNDPANFNLQYQINPNEATASIFQLEFGWDSSHTLATTRLGVSPEARFYQLQQPDLFPDYYVVSSNRITDNFTTERQPTYTFALTDIGELRIDTFRNSVLYGVVGLQTNANFTPEIATDDFAATVLLSSEPAGMGRQWVLPCTESTSTFVCAFAATSLINYRGPLYARLYFTASPNFHNSALAQKQKHEAQMENFAILNNLDLGLAVDGVADSGVLIGGERAVSLNYTATATSFNFDGESHTATIRVQNARSLTGSNADFADTNITAISATSPNYPFTEELTGAHGSVNGTDFEYDFTRPTITDTPQTRTVSAVCSGENCDALTSAPTLEFDVIPPLLPRALPDGVELRFAARLGSLEELRADILAPPPVLDNPINIFGNIFNFAPPQWLFGIGTLDMFFVNAPGANWFWWSAVVLFIAAVASIIAYSYFRNVFVVLVVLYAVTIMAWGLGIMPMWLFIMWLLMTSGIYLTLRGSRAS